MYSNQMIERIKKQIYDSDDGLEQNPKWKREEGIRTEGFENESDSDSA